MNTFCKRLISGLTAFSFALVTFVMPVSANVYFPPGFFSTDYITDNFPDSYFSNMYNYVNQYRSENPDTTFLEAYNAFKNSEYNQHHAGGGAGGDRDEEGSHHGGAGGHRDSDVIDKLFNYNEVTQHADDYQGTQTDESYLSYDGRISVEHERLLMPSGSIFYCNDVFYIYQDGVLLNSGSNNGTVCSYARTSRRYPDNNVPSTPSCEWSVKGTILRFTYYDYGFFYTASGSREWRIGKQVEFFDFSPFVTIGQSTNNYYSVTDNSGQSWFYDPITNYYYNDEGQQNYIDLDISQFPVDDFNNFIKEMQNINYDDSFQFLSLYNTLLAILERLQNAEGGGGTVVDLSNIKIDIPLNDYTSLLEAIEAVLVVMSENITTLSTHADCLEIIEIMTKLYNNSVVELSDLATVNQNLRDIMSRLDVIIELQDIAITQDVLDDISENEMTTITTYLTFITTLLSLYPLSFVSSAIDSTQAILFNSNTPPDLTINIRGNDYTLLSAGMIDSFAGALSIARGFASVVILYAWLIYMRRKIADTL